MLSKSQTFEVKTWQKWAKPKRCHKDKSQGSKKNFLSENYVHFSKLKIVPGPKKRSIQVWRILKSKYSQLTNPCPSLQMFKVHFLALELIAHRHQSLVWFSQLLKGFPVCPVQSNHCRSLAQSEFEMCHYSIWVLFYSFSFSS